MLDMRDFAEMRQRERERQRWHQEITERDSTRLYRERVQRVQFEREIWLLADTCFSPVRVEFWERLSDSRQSDERERDRETELFHSDRALVQWADMRETAWLETERDREGREGGVGDGRSWGAEGDSRQVETELIEQSLTERQTESTETLSIPETDRQR